MTKEKPAKYPEGTSSKHIFEQETAKQYFGSELNRSQERLFERSVLGEPINLPAEKDTEPAKSDLREKKE